jgi:SPP1 family holin
METVLIEENSEAVNISDETKAKPTARTVATAIISLVAFANTVLAMLDKPIIPLADEEIYTVVSVFFTLGSWIWGYWFNQSWSKGAIIADIIKADLKSSNSINAALVKAQNIAVDVNITVDKKEDTNE